MELIFLGTGTSTGVPQLMCDCPTCVSADPRDKRMRASAVLKVDGYNLLIDCGPDFRSQLLTLGHKFPLDALLITHTHYDHVGGIDDLRPYCHPNDFPVYCKPDVADDLRNRIPYSFAENPYPGVPRFELHEIDEAKPFHFNEIEIKPLPVNHYKLEILGYKIGNLAYITDAKAISESTEELVKGIDTLVINALRHEPHVSHFSLQDALDFIARVKPRIAYLTHFAHQLGCHAAVESTLPAGVHLAYDNLSISIP